MLFLAASLFFTTPAPLDMPRAEAYLVKDTDGSRRLEDRYNTFDLWIARAVVGRWFDDERTFVLSRMDALPPSNLEEPAETRSEFEEGLVWADPKDERDLRRMVSCLAPTEVAEKFDPPRQMPLGYDDIRYCQGTNVGVIVCAFRPKKCAHWFLATWELDPDDVFDEMLERFEHGFLDEKAWKDAVGELVAKLPRRRGRLPPERELLRRDLTRSVAAYGSWHASHSEDFSVIDSVDDGEFIAALTNGLPKWRSSYASALPTPLDGTNVLAVARIYGSRDDYLDVAGTNMAWTAAYWSPMRREIVAFLPESGKDKLLETIRHEAFHQYLSYATAMQAVSPWLNEGYAEYFENSDSTDWGFAVTRETVERLAAMLPAVFKMDYAAFYDGTDEERQLKYRLAWSVAVFLEHENGARKVRFEPFKTLKRDYIEALLKTHDMHAATDSAFGSTDRMQQFVAEWKRFWIGM